LDTVKVPAVPENGFARHLSAAGFGETPERFDEVFSSSGEA
jgi:hypothetical protein